MPDPGNGLSFPRIDLGAAVATLPSDVGDCNGDGEVRIDEVELGINIPLQLRPLADCPAIDANGNGEVEINEVLSAVNVGLSGCPTGNAKLPCHGSLTGQCPAS